MSAVETIALELGARSYDICVGRGLLEDAGSRIKALGHRPPVIVVTDETVAALHLATVMGSLEDAGVPARSIVLPPGEGTKDFAGLEMLCDAILDCAPERSALLVALGGGVIGDLVGFAASAILRGIDFVQIPTTLLAQVDSSVGGKTGINTRHGKNLVGAFYQPRLVLADTGVLDTLPRRELLAGYAEVAKYGLIGDADFFAWLEAHGADVIAGDADARRRAVVTSCRAKAAVVAGDERETGARALLNLGHTFGHALEAETGFGPALLHGEAVSIGMVMAFDLSARLGLCSAEDAARARRHLASVGLPTGLERLPVSATDPAALVAHMHRDKKVRNGRVTFILARGIGKSFVAEDIDLAEVEALLQDAAAAA
jgi:3-dehydroquinate synthase